MIFDENFPSNKISSLVRDVGYIFQNPDHQLFMQSVWDEAILTSKNLGIFTGDQKIRANEFFECLSLGEKRNDHPQRLSYGEKRRLNLLAVLLHQPRLLLIDEFLIGQDMANAHAWMRFFRDYTRQGNTILLVNHHTELTRQYCDRMIFLSEGKILINQPVKTAFDQLSVLNFSSYLPQGRKAYIYE
jgi:energy-coupling factor transport system ATP-binding protein